MAGPADLLINETDGFAADFTYYVLPITGSLAATEINADVATVSAAVEVEGSLAATETGGDTAAFQITHAGITGALAAVETGTDVAEFEAIQPPTPEANWTLSGSRVGSAPLIGVRATSSSLRGGM